SFRREFHQYHPVLLARGIVTIHHSSPIVAAFCGKRHLARASSQRKARKKTFVHVRHLTATSDHHRGQWSWAKGKWQSQKDTTICGDTHHPRTIVPLQPYQRGQNAPGHFGS